MRCGFSLLEVVVATFIVGMLLVATMKSVGAVVRGRHHTGESARAALLAQTLAGEILSRSYVEPDPLPATSQSAGLLGWLARIVAQTPASTPLGPEAGETSGGTRAAFDDVDDYHGLDESPPRARDGGSLGSLAGWRWTVTVAFAPPGDLGATSINDQGIKRVTIVVSRDGAVLARRVLIVTDGWQQRGGA